MIGRAAAVALLVAAACSGGDDPFVAAAQPAAVSALPDGGLLVGERLTGRILRVDADGVATEVAALEVGTDGEQRGLLGLASRGDEVYAAFTRASDGRIVVSRVLPAAADVWLGPASHTVANGGHLAWLGNDLVIGIGSLGDEGAINRPRAPNGKLLAIDPGGPPDQRGQVLTSGLHNPFAFAVADGGDIFIGDNSPGDEPERLLRWRDFTTTTLAQIAPHTVTSGIAIDADGSLLLCSYLTGSLQRWVVDGQSGAPMGAPLAADCRLGVSVLADGRIVYATEDALELVSS